MDEPTWLTPLLHPSSWVDWDLPHRLRMLGSWKDDADAKPERTLQTIYCSILFILEVRDLRTGERRGLTGNQSSQHPAQTLHHGPLLCSPFPPPGSLWLQTFTLRVTSPYFSPVQTLLSPGQLWPPNLLYVFYLNSFLSCHSCLSKSVFQFGIILIIWLGI